MLRSGWFRFWLLAVVCWLVQADVVRAQGTAGTIAARQEKGFGRIAFTFPAPVSMSARVTGGVLVVTFDREVRLPVEAFSARLPGYVAAARLDPDNRSLRFALNQDLRADLKDAAETMYLDLLPKSWRGPPPPLPPEVAADLARRARATRQAVAEATQAPAPPPALEIDTAESDTRRRIVFRLPTDVAANLEQAGDVQTVRFNGRLAVDPLKVRSALAGLVSDLAFPAEGRIRFRAPDAVRVEGVAEAGAFVVDLLKTAPAPVSLPPVKQPVAPAPTPAAVAPERPEAPAPKDSAGDSVTPPAPVNAPAAGPVQGPQTLRTTAEISGERLELTLQPAVPLAVIERGDALWLVTRGTRAVQAPRFDGRLKAWLTSIDSQQNDGWSVLRLGLTRRGLVAVRAERDGWSVTLGPDVAGSGKAVRFRPAVAADGRRQLEAIAPGLAEPVQLDDPDIGDRLIVVPMAAPVRMAAQRQRFAEFEVVPTVQGLAILPIADDIALATALDRVRVNRPGGLALSDDAPAAPEAGKEPGVALIDTARWNSDSKGATREGARHWLRAVADAPPRARTAPRLRLAGFYLANGYIEEAHGVLSATARDDAVAAADREVIFLSGLVAAQRGAFVQAARAFAHPGIAMEPEGILWRGFVEAGQGKLGAALGSFRQSLPALERMPEVLQALLRPAVIEAALSGGDTYLAGQQLGAIERMDGQYRDPARVSLLAGRIAEASGASGPALAAYRAAAASPNRQVEAEARLGMALMHLARGDVAQEAGEAELETIGMIWRGGPVEVRARAQLAELQVQRGQWREAFQQVRRAVEILPDDPVTRAMQAEASRRFSRLFTDGRSHTLDKVQALAIFDEFRWLIPPGAEGDEIVGHLAERLYDLDLIDQAADLLEHQVANRLTGHARARTAARLAMFQLANHRPQKALAALRNSRIATLPEDERRVRLFIEARAQTDLSRGDLALELIAGETGPDAERLRADIHWQAKRWRDAAEALERALGARWQQPEPLAAGERADVLRAGIGYVLAGEALGSDRLRSKYMPLMGESEDAAAFRLVTLEHLSRPDAFRDLARRAVSASSIGAFLEAYRKRYAKT